MDDVFQNQPQHVFTVEESTKLIIQISETFIFASTTEHTFKAQIMLYLILGKSNRGCFFPCGISTVFNMWSCPV